MLAPGGMMAARDAQIPDPPDQVQDNDASPISDTQIQQTWTDLDGENKYEAQIASDSDFSTIVSSDTNISEDATSKSWTGLSAETTYYTRVRAVNDAGNGPYSATASATTTDGSVAPGSPSGNSLSTNSSSQLDQSWDSETEADTYTAQIATDSGFNTIVGTQSGITGTSHTWSGLDEGTEHWARVKAVNSVGDSSYSSSDNATTKLAAPSGLDATDNGSFWRLSWTRNSDEAQNQQVRRGGSLYDTIPWTSDDYDVDEADAEGFSFVIRAIHSSIPDSDDSNQIAITEGGVDPE